MNKVKDGFLFADRTEARRVSYGLLFPCWRSGNTCGTGPAPSKQNRQRSELEKPNLSKSDTNLDSIKIPLNLKKASSMN